MASITDSTVNDLLKNWRINFLSSSVRQTYTIIPKGFYAPADLGLDLPKCTLISVGLCSALDSWKKRWTLRGRVSYLSEKHKWGLFDLAHAHDTRICFKDGRYIFKDNGIPDETVLHEYAHILAGCQDHGHDYVWVQEARNLGLENPTPHTSYVYAGEPKVVWGT